MQRPTLVGRATSHRRWSAWIDRVVATNKNCNLIRKQQKDPDVLTWLHLTRHAMASKEAANVCHLLEDFCHRVTEHRPLHAAPKDQLRVLSLMPPSEDACSSRYIEPLTGALRHPLVHELCNPDSTKNSWVDHAHLSTHVLNFTHILLPSGHCRARCKLAKQQKPRRHLYYDLGCSHYSDRNPGLAYKMAVRAAKSRNTTIQEEEARIWTQHEIKVNTTEKNSAVGASIEPLVQLYRKHCIEFDQVWGWDPRWSEKQFWARVPEWERHKITYFNEYVNATEQSALGVLRRTARPEDFVVFKLDIYTPHVEQQIMDTC